MIQQCILKIVTRLINKPVAVVLVNNCPAQPMSRFEFTPSRRRLYIPRV